MDAKCKFDLFCGCIVFTMVFGGNEVFNLMDITFRRICSWKQDIACSLCVFHNSMLSGFRFIYEL